MVHVYFCISAQGKISEQVSQVFGISYDFIGSVFSNIARVRTLVFNFIHPLVGWFGLNDPLRQYFSLYRAVSQREGERGEKR